MTSRPVAGADLAPVTAVHEGMPATPHYDGLYLDRALLRELPDDERALIAVSYADHVAGLRDRVPEQRS